MTITRTLVLGCVLVGTACHADSPVGPDVPPDRQFTLAPGQSASIQGTSLRIEFLRVSGDSRCPADVFCIQGGDAVVHVRVSDAARAEYELHTGDHSRAVARHAEFSIELVQLQPYPFSSRTIEPGAYRATLAVTRGTDGAPSSGPTAGQLAGTWNLVSIQPAGQDEQATPAGATYASTFADGRLSTRADCNTCNGPFSLSGQTLTAGPAIACTRAACRTMEFENAYTRMLAGEGTVALSDCSLVLSSPRGVLRFAR